MESEDILLFRLELAIARQKKNQLLAANGTLEEIFEIDLEIEKLRIFLKLLNCIGEP